MNQLAVGSLFAWPVIALVAFALLGPRRGVLFTLLGGWTLLPLSVVIELQGLPEYTKFTATGLASLLGILIFDAQRLVSWRPGWIDAPMAIWCVVPFISAITNGLAIWDGISLSSNQVIHWGIPYLIGRLHFTDPEGIRELALGIVTAGLVIAPLAVFEVVTQKSLAGIFYGSPRFTGYKYGLYSPNVFAAHSLELNLWMTLTALVAFWLWCAKAVQQHLGLPFGLVTFILISSAALCHQTAACALLGGGLYLIATTVGRGRFGSTFDNLPVLPILAMIPKVGFRRSGILILLVQLYQLVRKRHPQWIAIGLILIVPFYVSLRSTGFWAGEGAVDLAYATLGASRGWSLKYRMNNEDRLIRKAIERPIFGWGGFGRNRVEGMRSTTDSLWIIVLGNYGFAGLTAAYTILCLPPHRVFRRWPIKNWGDPRAASAASLGLMLVFYALDSLLNAATIHPAILITAGGLIALPAGRGGGRARSSVDDRLEWGDRLVAAGRLAEAEQLYRQAIVEARASSNDLEPLADALERQAWVEDHLGRPNSAEECRQTALNLRESLVASSPEDPEQLESLAAGLEQAARTYAAQGRVAAALACWNRLIEARAARKTLEPNSSEAHRAWLDSLNNAAWLLANGPDPRLREPRRAVLMAEQTVSIDPRRKAYWNTLGAARLRQGDLNGALAALGRSVHLGPDESGCDDALIALAHRKRGDEDAAQAALARLERRLEHLGTQTPPAVACLVEEAGLDPTSALSALRR